MRSLPLYRSPIVLSLVLLLCYNNSQFHSLVTFPSNSNYLVINVLFGCFLFASFFNQFVAYINFRVLFIENIFDTFASPFYNLYVFTCANKIIYQSMMSSVIVYKILQSILIVKSIFHHYYEYFCCVIFFTYLFIFLCF